MKIDTMPLVDLGSCRAIAKAIYNQIEGIMPPMPIEEIASAVGINDIQFLKTAGFEGALITDDAKIDGDILVNARAPRERQRFTIGHELGHFLNFWHKPPEGGFRCSTQDMLVSDKSSAHGKMETEANEFSAEILMPEELFRSDIQTKVSPGLEHIMALADKYDTSKLASAWRFVDLNDSPSAVILSKDGIVQFHRRRTDEFPYIELKRGQEIPKKSLTARFSGSGDGCSNTDETEPAFWISGRLPRGGEMYEQVLVQGKGYRITLLTIDEAEAEDDDEEYARDRSEWRPSFR